MKVTDVCRYLGELMNDRLITNPTKSSSRRGSFAPYASRVRMNLCRRLHHVADIIACDQAQRQPKTLVVGYFDCGKASPSFCCSATWSFDRFSAHKAFVFASVACSRAYRSSSFCWLNVRPLVTAYSNSSERESRAIPMCLCTESIASDGRKMLPMPRE
jgi:hypothetical protein